MSVKINVDPARLEASASHIEQMYMNYEREYRRLFQDVQTMGNNWQGKDNQRMKSTMVLRSKPFSFC